MPSAKNRTKSVSIMPAITQFRFKSIPSSASFAARADLAARLAAAFGAVHMHGAVEVYTAAAHLIITFRFIFLLHHYHVPSYKISSMSSVENPCSNNRSTISPVKPNAFATDFSRRICSSSVFGGSAYNDAPQ